MRAAPFTAILVAIAAAMLGACGQAAAPQPVDPAEFAAGTSGELLLGQISDDEQRQFEFLAEEWPETDLTRRTIALDQLERACFSRDCLCPIGGNNSERCDAEYEGVLLDHLSPPSFTDASQTPAYLQDEDPVVALAFNGEARAYPLAIMTRHEIVNDTVGGLPVAITYCPLCNSALVFARLDGEGRELNFGVAGLIVNSGFVMWDRQTESLWQQFTGRGIAGQHAGAQLNVLPSAILSLEQFRIAHPDGVVLQGVLPDSLYDMRQFPGYEEEVRPGFFSGDLDFRLPAAARVLGLNIGGASVAYAWSALMDSPVKHDTVAGTEIVIFYHSGTLSTFDAEVQMPESRNVAGSAAAFVPQADGMRLDFMLRNGVITDRQTGSEWSPAGVALQGDLRGEALEIVPAGNQFWFAWAAFNPNTELRGLG